MAKVVKCDICGYTLNNMDRFKVKGLYLKKLKYDYYLDHRYWKKIDICPTCQENIINAVKVLQNTEKG